ncbi:GNAT family N-acetyltransferase [Cupriavidus taiwanensis]|uniref:GNAT family N-acetyltransferase n=1 Tax=Cupriavidus taiwanensis TaxID=164546 RepID=UPI0012FE9CF1|nr:GNAT family N-acetyltransferase [Cupriavidus taiwanensis]
MSEQSFQHSVHRGVPWAAQTLIWEVFFSSRGRGIDLQTHYPWINTEAGVTSVLISQDAGTGAKSTAAALVIKEATLTNAETVGLVGMVCVHGAFRGQGLSHKLLSAATEVSKEKSYRSLILWTNKPHVYAGHGFAVDSHDRYGLVWKQQAAGGNRSFCHNLAGITVEDRSIQGVPAFAKSVLTFSNHTASITILPTMQGYTLAEWAGAWDPIFQIIEQILPERWNLNAPADSEIYGELIKRGYNSELHSSSQRMISNLSGKGLPDLPYIPLLNRI